MATVNSALGAMDLVILLANVLLEDYPASSLKMSMSLKKDKLKFMKPPMIGKQNMSLNMLNGN